MDKTEVQWWGFTTACGLSSSAMYLFLPAVSLSDECWAPVSLGVESPRNEGDWRAQLAEDCWNSESVDCFIVVAMEGGRRPDSVRDNGGRSCTGILMSNSVVNDDKVDAAVPLTWCSMKAKGYKH